MDNSNAQTDALKSLSVGRCLVAGGFVMVHIAAYGLFTGNLPEMHAVIGIIGLGCYRQGTRLKNRARQLLLDSLDDKRMIA